MHVLVGLIEEDGGKDQGEAGHTASEVEGIVVVLLSQDSSDGRTQNAGRRDRRFQVGQVLVSLARKRAIGNQSARNTEIATPTLA